MLTRTWLLMTIHFYTKIPEPWKFNILQQSGEKVMWWSHQISLKLNFLVDVRRNLLLVTPLFINSY